MKDNLVNFSEEKRNKLQAMDARKSASKSDNFKAVKNELSEETLNLIMDAALIARGKVRELLSSGIDCFSFEQRDALQLKEAKFDSLYKKLGNDIPLQPTKIISLILFVCS